MTEKLKMVAVIRLRAYGRAYGTRFGRDPDREAREYARLAGFIAAYGTSAAERMRREHALEGDMVGAVNLLSRMMEAWVPSSPRRARRRTKEQDQ